MSDGRRRPLTETSPDVARVKIRQMEACASPGDLIASRAFAVLKGVVDREDRTTRRTMHDPGPDAGHQFHFSVAITGSVGTRDAPHVDAGYTHDPITVTVRAWSLSEACRKASELGLAEWDVDR